MPSTSPPIDYQCIKASDDRSSLNDINSHAQNELWRVFSHFYRIQTTIPLTKRNQLRNALLTLNTRLCLFPHTATTQRHFHYLTHVLSFSTAAQAAASAFFSAITACHQILNKMQPYRFGSYDLRDTFSPTQQHQLRSLNYTVNLSYNTADLIEYDKQLIRLRSVKEVSQFVRTVSRKSPLTKISRLRDKVQQRHLAASLIQQMDNAISTHVNDEAALQACYARFHASAAIPFLLLECAKAITALTAKEKSRLYFHLIAQPRQLEWDSKTDYFRQKPQESATHYLTHLQHQLQHTALFDAPVPNKQLAGLLTKSRYALRERPETKKNNALKKRVLLTQHRVNAWL